MFRVIHPNRWFFWTISLLVVVGLILLFFIHQSVRELEEQSLSLMQNSVQNWRVFSSPALGLRLRYPPAWQIEVDPLEASTIYLENPNNFSENIAISVVSPNLEKIIRQSVKIASEQEILIDDTPGVWIKSSDLKDQATSNVVLVKRGGELYSFSGSARAFEKIMKGIKFIK